MRRKDPAEFPARFPYKKSKLIHERVPVGRGDKNSLRKSILSQILRKKSSESEIPVIFFADIGEKCGENLAIRKKFADFCPSSSKKSGRQKLHEKSSTNFTSHETKLFHREALGAGGPNSSMVERGSADRRE